MTLKQVPILVLCASVAIAAEQEPSFNGRLLSQWLGDLLLGGLGSTPTEGAVRAMGTNAIPTLLNWIAYEPSPSQPSSQSGQTVPSWRPHYPLGPGERAQRSQYAFEFLAAC
jgi:hypothetical protein